MVQDSNHGPRDCRSIHIQWAKGFWPTINSLRSYPNTNKAFYRTKWSIALNNVSIMRYQATQNVYKYFRFNTCYRAYSTYQKNHCKAGLKLPILVWNQQKKICLCSLFQLCTVLYSCVQCCEVARNVVNLCIVLLSCVQVC